VAYAVFEVDRLFWKKQLKNGEKSVTLNMAMAEMLLLYRTYKELRLEHLLVYKIKKQIISVVPYL
jgi:hypothetical protein